MVGIGGTVAYGESKSGRCRSASARRSQPTRSRSRCLRRRPHPRSRFALPPVNTRGVSSFTVCAPGTVFTGASFTAATLMVMLSVSIFGPPAPVLPLSFGADDKRFRSVGSSGCHDRSARPSPR